MSMTAEEIAKIAEWEPVHELLGRGQPLLLTHIQPIIDRITASRDLGCKILSDDGLSNYFTLFIFLIADVPAFCLEYKVNGVLLYLSSCAPVGVFGRRSRCVAPRLTSYDALDIEDLIDPINPKGELEKRTVDAVRSGGYELLSAEEVGRPLPSGVKPFEYCLCHEPWDKVFHALFANTD